MQAVRKCKLFVHCIKKAGVGSTLRLLPLFFNFNFVVKSKRSRTWFYIDKKNPDNT